MPKNLVIVESPAKAKTIKGYLGNDFNVMSSYGHVRDLAKKGLGVEIENNFTPKYEISKDKKSLVTELKKAVKQADTVWLATDEDREGEAISWHLYETLKLDKKDTKRITFNEITKTAVQKAIQSPREIDINLVNAQQARRVLDRLVGFELSPVLWKKVKPSLSAGRVQSVAVRIIVEREREIMKFAPQNYFNVEGVFQTDKNESLIGKLKTRLKTDEEVETFLNHCSTANFSIQTVKKSPGTRRPSAPFTTSTLQQEASLKLGFGVSRTMRIAQNLYEAGLITYMRTDSVNLSKLALQTAEQVITDKYGKAYSHPKQYANKSKGAQEAHEAIRPSNFGTTAISKSRDEQKLYDLIWKRAIASQMAPAKLERTTIEIGATKVDHPFVTKGEVIKFDGFLKVYLDSKLDETEENNTIEGLLPNVKEGEQLIIENITAKERFTKPQPRFVEASLVKKLEELGIGRPSTYAPTISTIQKRGYIEKKSSEGVERKYTIYTFEEGEVKKEVATEITGRDRNKLFPSDIGMVVTDFLVEHFGKILEYNFTAKVEEEFDAIANGLKEWTKMIKKFYSPFHENVEDTLENSERASGERYLGEDPKTGEPVIVRIGRYGPMAQIGKTTEDKKARFASLRNNQSIETIQLEDALELFKLPRELGEFEGKIVKANIGRFGPYVQIDRTFVSLKEDDPMEVGLDRAIELIKQKRIDDQKKIIKTFPEDDAMSLLNGRYGAYLKIGRKNYRLPKDVEPEKLTYKECVEIAENQPKKKPRKKKAAKKKTTKKK